MIAITASTSIMLKPRSHGAVHGLEDAARDTFTRRR